MNYHEVYARESDEFGLGQRTLARNLINRMFCSFVLLNGIKPFM